MQLYEITATDDDVLLCTRYQTNIREAKACQREMARRYNLRRSKTDVKRVVIPPGRPELANLLNRVFAQLDYDTAKDY